MRSYFQDKEYLQLRYAQLEEATLCLEGDWGSQLRYFVGPDSKFSATAVPGCPILLLGINPTPNARESVPYNEYDNKSSKFVASVLAS